MTAPRRFYHLRTVRHTIPRRPLTGPKAHPYLRELAWILAVVPKGRAARLKAVERRHGERFAAMLRFALEERATAYRDRGKRCHT